MTISSPKEEKLGVPEWEKEFNESVMMKYYGACFECCDFEEMMGKIKDFIAQVRNQTLEESVQKLETRKRFTRDMDSTKHNQTLRIAQATIRSLKK